MPMIVAPERYLRGRDSVKRSECCRRNIPPPDHDRASRGKDSVRNKSLAVARHFSRPWLADLAYSLDRSAFRIPHGACTARSSSPPIEKAPLRALFHWRRGRDSNPRGSILKS